MFNYYGIYPSYTYVAVYHTLKEMLQEFDDENTDYNVKSLSDTLGSVFAGISTSYDYSTLIEDNEEIEELWNDYLYPLYKDYYTVITREETTDEQIRDKYRNWFVRFIALLRTTSRRYVPIIRAFKNKETELLKQLENSNTGEVRFNDTPTSRGNYTADEYTSNITQSTTTSKADPDTIENRLASIIRKWKGVYGDWAEAFSGMFMEGDLNE